MIQRLFRIAVYALGAWISKTHCAEPWAVGPVFGIVVAVWDSRSFRGFFTARHAAFAAGSALLYALVFKIADTQWRLDPDWLEWIIGSVPVGVVVGSVLLPAAHRMILANKSVALPAVSAALAASFYAVTWTGGILDTIGASGNFDYYAVAVFLWQGLYLAFFFRAKSA